MFKRDGYLNPFVIQALGMMLLILFVLIWVLSGKESGLLVGAALTLTAMGSASGAIVTIRQEIVERQEEEERAEKERRKRPPRKKT